MLHEGNAIDRLSDNFPFRRTSILFKLNTWNALEEIIYIYIYDILNRGEKNCSNDKLVKKKNFFQNSTIIFRDILFLPNDAQSPKKEKKSMKLMRVECEEKDK